MSMYVELLAGCLDGSLEETTGDELVTYAILCRLAMLAHVPGAGTSAYSALATEIAYDRALLRLCLAHDIEAAPARFAHPAAERGRLERALGGLGIDLRALASRSPRVSPALLQG